MPAIQGGECVLDLGDSSGHEAFGWEVTEALLAVRLQFTHSNGARHRDWRWMARLAQASDLKGSSSAGEMVRERRKSAPTRPGS